jgi:crossover junction endodeoxyribonuclease RuvC
MTIIIGIDPGSRITGYGIIESAGNVCNYITSGFLKLTKTGSYQELEQIFNLLAAIISAHKPEEAAIEQIFMHANANSALVLGQARGAALVAMANAKLSIAEYSTRQVKQAVVGYGNAEKRQVQQMVKAFLKLSEIPQPDEADALAVAICHASYRRMNKIQK